MTQSLIISQGPDASKIASNSDISIALDIRQTCSRQSAAALRLCNKSMSEVLSMSHGIRCP